MPPLSDELITVKSLLAAARLSKSSSHAAATQPGGAQVVDIAHYQVSYQYLPRILAV